MPSWKNNYLRYRSIFSRITDLYLKREDIRIFLELFLTLGTIVIFSVFALKPTLITITSLYKEIKAKEDTVAKMDSKIKSLIEAENTLSTQQENITLLEQAIPRYAYPDRSTAQFIALSQQYGVNLNGVFFEDINLKDKPQKKSSNRDVESLPENVESISITIDFNSDYLTLIETLKTIENMRRPLKLDSVSWTNRVTQDTGISSLGISISGRLPLISSSTDSKTK